MSPRRLPHTPTSLTSRQADVLALVTEGQSNREIAGRLGISENGVKGHVGRLLAKFDVPTRAALVAASGAQTAPPAKGVLPLLEASLTDILGERATQLLLLRSCRLAGIDERRLAEPSLSVSEVTDILNRLWPLLIESGGTVLVRRLRSQGLDGGGDRTQEGTHGSG